MSTTPTNVLLLGGSGYVGKAFQDYLTRRQIRFLNVSRAQLDYTQRGTLISFLREHRPSFLINAAGYTGKPNVDACELHKADTLLGNAVLPGTIREACEETGTPWGHVSSGCIFSGRHESGRGFLESDVPNFSFRNGPCSFYSGTKALGEEILEDAKDCFVWRLRIPFDSTASPRNYLVKVMSYARLLEAENSISHLGEYVRACFELWEKGAEPGVYNVTQPDPIQTSDVVRWIEEEGERRKKASEPNPLPEDFSFFSSEEEFMRVAAKTPRSNCVMETGKLRDAGIHLSPTEEIVRTCLREMLVPEGHRFRK
ncbi:MAG: sugar nucleotide-binding protein [Verrucomicrobiota bacterium]